MEYQIVFLDIDGTLINEEKIIPPDTLEAIQELQRNKIEVVLATDRGPARPSYPVSRQYRGLFYP